MHIVLKQNETLSLCEVEIFQAKISEYLTILRGEKFTVVITYNYLIFSPIIQSVNIVLRSGTY